MQALAAVTSQVARSYPVADAGGLLDQLDCDVPLAWVQDGQGMVGWGEYARIELLGPDRFATAQRWWEELSAGFAVDDSVRVPGSGLVAFASFGFDSASDRSVVIVPRVVVGRRDGHCWMTVIGDESSTEQSRTAPADGLPANSLRFADGAQNSAQWASTVQDALTRIAAGELSKVVLARDLIATTTAGPIDQCQLLRRLGGRYPACWTFAVDRLIGATPELLVSRIGDRVKSRVLAGTVRRTGSTSTDAQAATDLLSSAKDVQEHRFAVQSVANALAEHCTELHVPGEPSVLALANVQHLASDITARVGDGSSALALAGAVHPTAAVCGTPTNVALEVIRELESMDRDRYAGPVGWIGAGGDGEFGIALRCGLVSDTHVRLFAGCGIVAGSDPQAELAEADAKFAAMRDALSSDS